MASERIEKLKRPKSAKAEPAPQPPPAKKPDTGPRLRHRCGHERPLKELENADCPSCRQKASEEKSRLKREKRAMEPQPEPKIPPRCPDGTVKTITWDREAGLWSGEMRLPDGTTFTTMGRTEREVMHRLHDCWQNAAKPIAESDKKAS